MGGSEATTDSVLQQWGHWKQFLAQLNGKIRRMIFGCYKSFRVPILFCTHTGARHFKQAVGAVVSADFYSDTAIASNRITFFTEIQVG